MSIVNRGASKTNGHRPENSDLHIPDDLTELDQWVLWRHERETKVPYQTNGHPASSTDPSTWSSFETAIDTWRNRPKLYVGVGYVLSRSDPFVGVDLDDCLESESVPKPWVRGIVARFCDTYTEISPSGIGLKLFARGRLPANVGRVIIRNGKEPVGAIEMYSQARFFTVTGRAFNNSPIQIEDHAADILELYKWARGSGRRGECPANANARIPHGRQHLTLVSICGTLRRRGLCDEAIEACLQIVNAKQCERPGPPENIRRIVQSSRRWSVI
jgi:Primase C terminal 1 (PriCT-1)